MEPRSLHLQAPGAFIDPGTERGHMTGHGQRVHEQKPLVGVDGADGLTVAWRKSSYSNHQSACVEVGGFGPETVGFRDSKDPEGAVLTFGRDAVAAFVAAVAAGEFTEKR
jgi:hypothetical protein